MTLPLIKRYPNRKLYDTEAKRYVTLDDVAALIRAGQEVQVIDHETGDDLTDITLARIIFAQARRHAAALPRAVLAHLIRAGTTPPEAWRRRVELSIEALLAEGELSQSAAERLREALAGVQPTEVSLSSLVEQRLQRALRCLNLPSQSDLQRLRAQLDELAQRLDEICLSETGLGEAIEGTETSNEGESGAAGPPSAAQQPPTPWFPPPPLCGGGG